MNGLRLKRRTFLRGVGGAMLALPVLECMLDRHGQALAQGQPLPKRFGVFFWGNGVRLDRWVPAATGAGYALSPALAPLQPVRDYVNVVTNFEIKARGPRGHHDGVSGMLSGVEFIELPHPNSNYSSKFGGPSIDNILHQDLGIPDSKPVLNLRTVDEIVDGEGPTLQFISHKGPDEPQPATRSPAAVWQQLFGDFTPVGTTDPKNELRANILDLVKDDITRLQPRLSRHDRQRLDAHFTGISELASGASESTLTAIGVLLLLPVAFNYLTAKRALLIGMACWAIRYAIFAKSGNTEWMLITGVALHGLCYDFFFVTGMQYADRRAPAGLRNLAQSAVSWVTLGLGLWAGNMIAPLLDSRFIDRSNPAQLVFKDEFWLYPSVFAAVLLVIFAVFYRDETRLTDQAQG